MTVAAFLVYRLPSFLSFLDRTRDGSLAVGWLIYRYPPAGVRDTEDTVLGDIFGERPRWVLKHTIRIRDTAVVIYCCLDVASVFSWPFLLQTAVLYVEFEAPRL